MTVERFHKYAQREGIAIGLAEGIQQKALETAKITLENNIPIEMIQKLTGLSIESINSLSENL